MAKIYPRLESSEYEEKIQFVENQIKSKGSYNYTATDSDLQWLPMGNRAELKEIENLRFNIISFMHSECLKSVASAQERTAFDRKLGLKLIEWLDITPSIAADNGMWAFMNIILIPELIQIRWGYTEKGEQRKINHERYYDTNRAYLKKLWFTAYLIDDKELYMKLKQDEIDVWYDKSFNRGLDNYIQQIYKSFYANVEKFKVNIELGDLYRQFLKLLNRKLAYINYYSLDKENLECLLNECFKTVYEEFKNAQIISEKLNAKAESEKNILPDNKNASQKKVVIRVKNPQIERLRMNEKHSLDEDFENTIPIGFIFGNIPFENTNTWVDLYTAFISYCAKKLPNEIRNLADNPRFISKSGRKYFSATDDDLRKSVRIMSNFYIETNLSANYFVHLIIVVLEYLKVPRDRFEIYLKK